MELVFVRLPKVFLDNLYPIASFVCLYDLSPKLVNRGHAIIVKYTLYSQ